MSRRVRLVAHRTALADIEAKATHTEGRDRPSVSEDFGRQDSRAGLFGNSIVSPKSLRGYRRQGGRHWAILEATDRETWCAAMHRAGADDVYFLPQYHLLYRYLDVRCLAYTASVGGEHLFHPFLLRSIGRVGKVEVAPELCDLETVYGYSGPVATSSAPDFLAEAWKGFAGWCAEHRVVCEFLRFSPFFASERYAAPGTEVRLDRETVEIRLEGGEEQLWASYESTQRNRVRKAIKRGLSCEETPLGDGLATFCDLYEGTMQRAGATDFYYFPPRYYEELQRTLAEHTRLFIVHHEDRAIAAGLFFVYGRVLHYHLGASREDALSLAPNNMMFHQVARWGQERGFERLHLGGGRSSAPDDALLRFKKRFSKTTLPFHLGQRVQDPERYAELCEIWREQAGGPAPLGYFRPYRLDPSISRSAA
ncbi:MAG: GNAT family N-acetyltransferase [Pseudomonadota bacterium]